MCIRDSIETGYVFCYTCIYNYLIESHKHIKKKRAEESDEESDNEGDSDEESNDFEKPEGTKEGEKEASADSNLVDQTDIDKGGRCPITGRRLLACRWNSLTQEFEVDGIRRLIF